MSLRIPRFNLVIPTSSLRKASLCPTKHKEARQLFVCYTERLRRYEWLTLSTSVSSLSSGHETELCEHACPARAVQQLLLISPKAKTRIQNSINKQFHLEPADLLSKKWVSQEVISIPIIRDQHLVSKSKHMPQ